MIDKKYIYVEPEKPIVSGVVSLRMDYTVFGDPAKAEAIIRHLSLGVDDSIRESGDYYVINPRMVLEGNGPEYYVESIKNLKKILTHREVAAINNAIRRCRKVSDKLYDKICKRTDSLYWRGEIRKSVPEDVREALEFFKQEKHTGVNTTIYHLLSNYKLTEKLEDYMVCYNAAWREKPVPDIREWHARDDGEYRVLTDSEADTGFDDSLEEYLWEQAVSAHQTTLGYDDWCEMVRDNDGRGGQLATYDGSEEDEEVDGVTYYIYRTN